MTVQFTLWDKFKELEEKSDTNISNLAAVLSFLIRTKAMSLAVFKVSCLHTQLLTFLKICAEYSVHFLLLR